MLRSLGRAAPSSLATGSSAPSRRSCHRVTACGIGVCCRVVAPLSTDEAPWCPSLSHCGSRLGHNQCSGSRLLRCPRGCHRQHSASSFPTAGLGPRCAGQGHRQHVLEEDLARLVAERALRPSRQSRESASPSNEATAHGGPGAVRTVPGPRFCPVVIVVATLTFGSGYDTLVSQSSPLRLELELRLVVKKTVSYLRSRGPCWTRTLMSRPGAASASPIFRSTISRSRPFSAGTHAYVAPPMLSGHPLEGQEPDRPRSGDTCPVARTSRRLCHRVVRDAKGRPCYVPPTAPLIVGTATLPAIGTPQALHTSMGTGAVISGGLEPPRSRSS